ncbi:MAG: ATP synthase subunit I [Deltaproteobacteria bacterium]|nr:ATP synthase subunit I [Deltaproteobacteria bacterium]
MNPIAKDPLQSRIEITNWVVLAVLIAVSWFFASPDCVLGITLGGLISIINYHWLYRDLKKVFQNTSDGAKSAIMFKYFVRFIITGVVILLILIGTKASVIGLLVGLSVVVINMVLNTVINILTTKENNLKDDEP